jgi:hypothetical protein
MLKQAKLKLIQVTDTGKSVDTELDWKDKSARAA